MKHYESIIIGHITEDINIDQAGSIDTESRPLSHLEQSSVIILNLSLQSAEDSGRGLGASV